MANALDLLREHINSINCSKTMDAQSKSMKGNSFVTIASSNIAFLYIPASLNNICLFLVMLQTIFSQKLAQFTPDYSQAPLTRFGNLTTREQMSNNPHAYEIT